MLKNIDWAKGNRGVVILILLATFMLSCGSTEESQDLIVTGVVADASGDPVAGAYVKVSSADLGLTYMVISQAEGRYRTPSLLPGSYTVQGIGGDYESEAAGPVEVSNGQQGKMDLVLNALRKVFPPPKKYTDAEFVEMMPAGEGKRLLLTRCILCHSPGNFVSRRKKLEDWKYTVDRMSYYLEQNSGLQKQFNVRTGREGGAVSATERKIIADYLATNFGLDKPPLFGPPPTDPNRHFPRTFPKGTEANYFAMELNLGESTLVGGFVADDEGTVWISEKTSGILGRLDTTTLTYTRLHTPPAQNTRALFGTVALDPQRHVWFTSNVVPGAQWFEYDPQSNEVVNTYDVPVPTTYGGDIFYHTLRFHPNGSVWATGTAYHRIVTLDPSTRKVTEYPVRYGQHPFGIVIGGDQKIWYAGDHDNFLGRMDPNTGEITEFELPTPDSRPRRLTTDAEGNIWANTLSEGKLVKLDYRTGEMTEYSPPTAAPGQGVDVDKERNLVWFGEYGAVRIGRLDPRTNAFVEFPLTNANAQPWIIQADPSNRNRVWWNSRNGRIGYMELME